MTVVEPSHRPLRILLVSQEYPPETAHGGIATQTHQKARGLAARGHHVHVLSHSVDGRRSTVRQGRVSVTRIPGLESDLPIRTEVARWIAWSVAVARELDATLAADEYDLIDFPEYGAEGYVHLLNRTGQGHVPVVIQLHGPLVMLAQTLGWPEPGSPLYRVGTAMEAECLKLADRVYSSSACSARWCAQEYGLELPEVPVIHAGVDTTRFRPLSVARETVPTVAFVGRVSEAKGVFVLLEAALRLAARGRRLRLLMLGAVDDATRQVLTARARDAGHPDVLQLRGAVSSEVLPDLLSRCHVFAAPSRYEGGPGFVYLEAMACGLPVVACAGSGATEAFVDGEHGLAVPPDDVEALARSLTSLLDDEARRVRMGRQARDHVERTADSSHCLSRLEAFYRSVAGDRSSAREPS